jgi:hypothetical protein
MRALHHGGDHAVSVNGRWGCDELRIGFCLVVYGPAVKFLSGSGSLGGSLVVKLSVFEDKKFVMVTRPFEKIAIAAR